MKILRFEIQISLKLPARILFSCVVLFLLASCTSAYEQSNRSASYISGYTQGANLGSYEQLNPNPEDLANQNCNSWLSNMNDGYIDQSNVLLKGETVNSDEWFAGCLDGYMAAYNKTGGLTRPSQGGGGHPYNPNPPQPFIVY